MSDNKCETKICVACEVNKCIYHTADNMCSAGKIQVGHKGAVTEGETCCETFSAK